jgi:hypothetical protein
MHFSPSIYNILFLSENFFQYFFHVLSVDIKTWDIQNLLIVYQTFELSLKIKTVNI